MVKTRLTRRAAISWYKIKLS